MKKTQTFKKVIAITLAAGLMCSPNFTTMKNLEAVALGPHESTNEAINKLLDSIGATNDAAEKLDQAKTTIVLSVASLIQKVTAIFPFI